MKKFINKLPKNKINKYRLLTLLVITLILIAGNIAYTITFGEHTIDYETDPDYITSRVFENKVYINELESDYNYYMGLNYTTNDGQIPTKINKNIYSDNNLVQVKITYSSDDLSGNVGYVSLTERQDTYIYFKTYYINDNNTKEDLTDDYIDIELIDNPFTDRPTNLGFNGWFTKYRGAFLTYNSNFYERYAKIPVTYTNNKPDKIDITFNANWIDATIVNVETDFNNAISSLKTAGMHQIESGTYYFSKVTVGMWESYAGYYNSSGEYQNSGTCYSWGGCTYYRRLENETLYQNGEYYLLINGTMTRATSLPTPPISPTPSQEYDNVHMANYYRKVTIPRYASIIGYYNNLGEIQTSGTCNTNSGCTYYELVQYYDSNGNEEIYQSNYEYYYLTTRDTNILVLNRDISQSWQNNGNYPFTLTSLHNHQKYNATWRVESAINCYQDTTIENVTMYYPNNVNTIYNPPNNNTTSGVLYGNYNNVKLGRGITSTRNYYNLRSILGGNNNSTGSSGNPAKYKVIIESGLYNSISLSTGANSNNWRINTVYLNNKSIYGNDYDRVNNNNNNLKVYYCASGSWGGNVYANTNSTTSSDKIFDLIIKSGSFGTSKHDLSTGIYVGGRFGGTQYAVRQAIVQGGYIYNLIGGPISSSNRNNYNDIYIYVTGGEIDEITGGAGTSATYGNRIIQITGGTINYSVFGGSNGVDGNDGDGTLKGSSYLYIGGNAIIGKTEYIDNNNTLWGAESGSVFGNGNGNSSVSSIGSCDNSTIIVDGNALIKRNVYGGGNYGATGISSSSNTSNTTIAINGGIIKGDVYGGGNKNGAGSASKTANVNIEMNSGVIAGSMYGGSNIKGTIYGTVDITMLGGEISNSIYGGGKGGKDSTSNGTYVKNAVNITIGDNASSYTPIINNSIYGGSAYGTVNGTTNTTTLSNDGTTLTINKGIITNVFGGGQGNDTYTPYVLGNIKVTINDGHITKVFGGNDKKGTPNGKIEVIINGGEINETYGGGNETSAKETNVYLNGGTSTLIFGGSNLTGTVNTSNIVTTGGTSQTIYGGNNQGGTTGITNVTINGGNIGTVYGGGEATSVENNTNVIISSSVDTVFGGSNIRGNIPKSNITINDANTKNVYGGNNQGGTTTETNINILGGIQENVYGGGLKAETTTTNIYANSGYIKNLYGGGSEAGAPTTNVFLGESSINNVFGGSNISGDVANSYITNTPGETYNSTDVQVTYGESTQHDSSSTDYISSQEISVNIQNKGPNTITKWDLYLFTSEGFIANNWSSATIENTNDGYHINEINRYYGTNTINSNNTYQFSFHVHSNVSYEEFKIYNYYFIGTDNNGNKYTTSARINNLYGGNNEGGTTESTHIDLTKGTINNLYGGGNKAITKTTDVKIYNTTILNAAFGGGNEAKVENANINLSSSTVGTPSTNGDVYGGGNNAEITQNVILNTENNTTINGNVYGGGNLGAVLGIAKTTITDSKITSSIYGGGNKASVGTANNTNNNVVDLSITNSEAQNIYGGGNAAGVIGNTKTHITSSSITDSIYGGGNGTESIVPGDTTGEQNLAKINGNVKLIVDEASTANNIYGGGNLGMIVGSTDVTLKKSTVTSSIYGGGNAAIVNNNTYLLVSLSTINNSVYAGGNGTTAIVKGNTNLDIENNTNITNHVFGGGNAAATGQTNIDNSTGIVNISGATIGKNVYGGANTSVLYGITTVNIGKNAVSNKNLITSNITIGGTIFGGGEANASGSEIYDFNFISVTKGININIDASEHQVFIINGSIFGSGNASSTSGYSYININNYGTQNDVKRNISIQRANIVTLNNSYMELSGATDRTNEYSNVLFTLSRIDELKIKNSSSIYLEKGANLVKKLKSSVDIDNIEATAIVNINNETGTFERNVNNRIYMLEGENLNIAKNESVTEYGDISGMTFFGMYRLDRNDNIITALYDDYAYGAPAISGDIYYFTDGSYVLGKHLTNHDITKNGFYSNYGSEEGDNVIIKYIEPTPADSNFYMWSIGEVVASYDVNLTASKYSTLGTLEVPLINHATPNTTFSILGVNFSELDPGISLIDYKNIPRVASSGEIADTVFGLNMKSGQTGWLNNGSTNFITEGENNVTGTKDYIRENFNNVPALVFYLYHSKNLTTSGEMGSVTISLVAITPIDDLNNEVERININVSLSRALYNTNDYEGTITPGKEYEMFATSNVDITTKSSFSTYYSLYMNSETTPYKTGYYRSLVSSFVLPINTKITMIDLHNKANPVYYYYVIDENDYNQSLIEFAQNNNKETSYNLSKFIKMGSTSINNNYNDALANTAYYNNKIAEEEFIFMVDFKDSNITENKTNETLLIELRNAEHQTLISVLGIEQQTLKYNLYVDSESSIDMSGKISKNPIYLGNSTNLTIDTNFVSSEQSSNIIYDTTFDNEKLGIKISIYDSHNTLLSAQDLLGVNFTYQGNTYYPRYDGTTRIKISDKVANARSKITLNTGTSKLSTGEYTIKIESFGSYDGIYYGPTPTNQMLLKLNIIASPYGLSINTADKMMFVNKDTGFTLNDNNLYAYKINYISELNSPNLHLKLERRDYTSVYSNIYNEVDLLDYVTDNFQKVGETNEYILTTNPVSNITYSLHFKENLMTGTYRLVVSLYDDTNYIGDVYHYIIIR